MKGYLMIMAFLFVQGLHSQALLTVDRTEIQIGDQIRATIRIDAVEGREWINADRIWPDSLKGIEVIAGPEWNKENPKLILATWRVAFFDTGWVRIPSLPVVLQSRNQMDTQYTHDVPVLVSSVEPDSSGLLGIKDIQRQPFRPGYFKRYLPYVVLGLLVLAGLIYWMRKRRRRNLAPVIIPGPPAPHEWAYRALDKLAADRLWQSGEIKEHYSRLTAILREYLERRFDIHALEQTTDEILNQLHRQNLELLLIEDTRELLSVADLIKFAKADPGVDIHAETIKRVRTFILHTTIRESVGTDHDLKNGKDEVVE